VPKKLLLLWADFNSLFTVTIRNDKRNISGINSAILGWGRGEDNINGITKQQRINLVLLSRTERTELLILAIFDISILTVLFC